MALAVKQQQTVAQDIPTQQQSLTLMRNLLRTSISCICYLRNLFDESCFIDKNLTGINIKALCPNDAESRLLCQWLENGVFDALERRYLERIVFGIYVDPKNENTLVESYNFHITYPTVEEISLSIDALSLAHNPKRRQTFRLQTKAEIKEATIVLIRRLICITQTLNPLPPKRYITMRLFYSSDAPKDYQPKFFRNVLKNNEEYTSEPLTMKVGSVSTPYYTIDLNMVTATDGTYPIETPSRTTKAVSTPEESESETEEETQDTTSFQEYYSIVKNAILHGKVEKTRTAILTAFYNIPPNIIEEICQLLLRDGVLSTNATTSQVEIQKSALLKDIEAINDPRANELVNLYMTALKYISTQSIVSVKKLRNELSLGSHLASELMCKLYEDGCVSEFSYRAKGRFVNVERVREVIQQLQKPISRMNATSQNNKKRKRSEEQDEEISTPFLKFQKSSEE